MKITKKKKRKEEDVVEETPFAGEPYQQLDIDDCIPNDWNPNVMSSSVREKTQKGIEVVLEQAGVIPPIVVRKHPDFPGKFQIIDGYHRWDILRLLGKDKVDAFVINVDTKIAMTLTSTLNYLRGEPNQDQYAKYLYRLMDENRVGAAAAAEYLPETKDEIDSWMASYNMDIDHIEVDDGLLKEESEERAEEHWIELKVLVSREQAEIIEGEVARIAGTMKGSKRNIRGRAMEFMAVNSSQTPIRNLTGEEHEEEADEPLEELSAEEEATPKKKKVKHTETFRAPAGALKKKLEDKQHE